MDARIAVWAATHRIAALNDFFVGFGTIDKLGAVWVAIVFVAAALQRRPAAAIAALTLLTFLATFAADSLSFLLKDLTSRERPFEAHPEIHPLYVVHSSSFPAGHAATAFAGAVVAAAVARRCRSFFAVLAIAIAYSRVYVGVHYPTDVLVGAAVGAAVGVVAILVARAASHRRLPGIDRRLPRLA